MQFLNRQGLLTFKRSCYILAHRNKTMRFFLLLIPLIAYTSDAAIAKAIEPALKEAVTAKSIYDSQVRVVTAATVAELEKTKLAVMQTGDLEASIKVRDKISQVKERSIAAYIDEPKETVNVPAKEIVKEPEPVTVKNEQTGSGPTNLTLRNGQTIVYYPLGDPKHVPWSYPQPETPTGFKGTWKMSNGKILTIFPTKLYASMDDYALDKPELVATMGLKSYKHNSGNTRWFVVFGNSNPEYYLEWSGDPNTIGVEIASRLYVATKLIKEK